MNKQELISADEAHKRSDTHQEANLMFEMIEISKMIISATEKGNYSIFRIWISDQARKILNDQGYKISDDAMTQKDQVVKRISW